MGLSIRLLQPGDEELLESFLIPQLESSMFLIGNMRRAGLLDRGQFLEGTYAAAFEDDRVVAVVAHYWNGSLIFQAPDHAIPLSAAALAGSGRPVRGLLGPSSQVALAMGAFAIDPSIVQMDETENLYSLALDDLIIPDNLASGQVVGRLIQESDLEIATEWRVGYEIEALGEEESPELRERCRRGVERTTRDKQTWVVERAGELVACSSFNTAIKEAVQVGGVWTPPELRSQHLGRAAVATSLLDARAAGARKAILFTGEDHIPAQKAYQALGFRHIGDYRIVLLQSPVSAIVQ